MAFFFFQAEDGIRDGRVTGVQTCALPISPIWRATSRSVARTVALRRNTVSATATCSSDVFSASKTLACPTVRSEEGRGGKGGSGGWSTPLASIAILLQGWTGSFSNFVALA